MCASASSLRQRWWQKRRWQVALFGAFSIVTAIIAANIEGFVLFLIVVVAAPLISILRFFPPDKRRFPAFVWLIYSIAWLIGALFFWALSINATFKLGWLALFLIGSNIPRLILSALIGILVAALMVILPVFIEARVAAIWVLALNRIYGISQWQAIRLMISLMLRFNPPIFIVEDGQVKETQPKGWPERVGGPALVSIRPYNAVVFERAGQVTRIEGPGNVLMKFAERIREVVDLRRQAMPIDAQQVLTRDRVPLRVLGGVAFRIHQLDETVAGNPQLRSQLRDLDTVSFLAAGPNSHLGARDNTRIHRQAVYDVVYQPRLGQRWTERVQGDAESAIRRMFRNYDFQEIYKLAQDNTEQAEPNVPATALGAILANDADRSTVIDVITTQVLTKTRENARQYGVFVFGVGIRTIQIDRAENVHNAYFDALIAEWHKRAQLTQAEADHTAFADRAKIQSRLLIEQMDNTLGRFRDALDGMHVASEKLPKEVIERYLQVSEHLLENIITDHTTARHYLDTMETLARVSPNTIIAAGLDVSQVSGLIAPDLKRSSDVKT